MIILNLGCGTKTSSYPGVINIDWSLMLRIRQSRVAYPLVRRLVDSARRDRLERLPNNVFVHDLSKGIPFEDSSVDVVYHSHFLEHLERHVADQFLAEVRRVLRPNGIHRIVVPDFELLARDYMRHLEACEANEANIAGHDGYIGAIIEQCVRREAFGTSQQPPLRRAIENVLLGDARRRGETHQWMYDRFSLGYRLRRAGFREVRVHEFDTSEIPSWNEIGLDVDENGEQYKKGSLYLEALA